MILTQNIKQGIYITIFFCFIFSLFFVPQSEARPGGFSNDSGMDAAEAAADASVGEDSSGSSGNSGSGNGSGGISTNTGPLGYNIEGLESQSQANALSREVANNQGISAPNANNGRGYEVGTSASSDGSYGVSVESANGGDGSWQPPVGTIPPGGGGCPSSVKPELTPVSLAFIDSSSSIVVPSGRLVAGRTYYVQYSYINVSCAPTNATGFYHSDTPTFGQDGSFPVSYRLDLDKDGVFDAVSYKNNQGPVANTDGLQTVSFPPFTATAGTHSVEVILDVSDDQIAGKGCLQANGCIEELNETNNIAMVDFTAADVDIDLGSFSYVNNHTITSAVDISNPSSDAIRTIGNEEIGLYWEYSNFEYVYPCSGSGPGFTAYPDITFPNTYTYAHLRGDPLPSSVLIPPPTYDLNITEPVAGSNQTYTITCPLVGGGTVSDSVTLNHGGIINVALRPYIVDITTTTDTLIQDIPFSVENIGVLDVAGYSYTLSIDGTSVSSGSVSDALSSGQTKTHTASVSWTAPSTAGSVPMELCIAHPDMPSNRCDQANIVITNNSSGGTDPIITATPRVVREGTVSTISWDMKGNTGCVLTPGSIFTGIDPYSITSTDITVSGAVTLSIVCDGGYTDDVQLLVLPILYES